MDEARWRRMLGAALPAVRLGCPQEKGKKPRVQMLQELLQREVKPVPTPVAIIGSLVVCIYVPASRHWLISYSPIHLT